MTSRERVEAAVQGKPTDRTPFALWRHFPKKDQTSQGLAEAVINFQKRFEFDLVKITPTAGYLAEALGCKFIFSDSEEDVKKGTRTCVFSPVKGYRDWEKLPFLDTREGILKRELEALKLIRQGVGGEIPVLQTIPSPLTIIKKLAENSWLDDLRNHSEELKKTLAVLSEGILKFSQASIGSGADGIFFYTQTANYDLLSEEEFKSFGAKYDYQILNSLKNKDNLLVLHVHGLKTMFDIVKDYPVQIINWHDRRTQPSLAKARETFKGAVFGGLDELGALMKGPEEASKEAKEAIEQTNGRGLILGPGCIILLDTPEQNILAIKKSLT